ncbi:MAG: hypothetical protein ACEQSB_01295 [Undibacterium sp.]
MKAVLSIPHHWQQNRRYATLGNREFIAGLSRQIAQGLRLSTSLYQLIPPSVPVEINWLQDHTNPTLVEPTLIVIAEGAAIKPQPESVAQSAYRLAQSLGSSNLSTLIPDCRICLRVVFEHTEALGG